MKVFKKIMNAVAAVENCILVVSTLWEMFFPEK